MFKFSRYHMIDTIIDPIFYTIASPTQVIYIDYIQLVLYSNLSYDAKEISFNQLELERGVCTIT
jgi:hypothetical protein